MSKKETKEPTQIDGLEIIKEIELPSGKTAVILEGKGKHSQIAGRMADGKSDQYMPALMHLLTRVDGEKVAIEEFEDWSLRDYNRLTTEFSELYFL